MISQQMIAVVNSGFDGYFCSWRILLCPPVVTVGVGADVVQLHLCFGFLGVRLQSQKLVLIESI